MRPPQYRACGVKKKFQKTLILAFEVRVPNQPITLCLTTRTYIVYCTIHSSIFSPLFEGRLRWRLSFNTSQVQDEGGMDSMAVVFFLNEKKIQSVTLSNSFC